MPPPAPLPFDTLDLPVEEVERRFAWARRRGHPSYVWPDVPMARWAEASRAVEAATVAALRCADPDPSEEAVLSWGPSLAPHERARATGVAAFTSGMGPLLGRWLEDGRLRAEPAIADVLELHLRHGRSRAERVGALLARLAQVLAGLDARPVILKGVHTGHTVFPEPGCRVSADVDVLVRPGVLADVEGALAGAGFVVERRQRRPTRTVWRAAGPPSPLRSLALAHADGPLTVDVHDSLERDLLGVRRVSPETPRPESLVRIPGVPEPFLGLPPAHLLLSLALHASEDLHNLQLVRVLEVSWVGRAAPPGEWPAFVELAEAAGALRFTWPALSLAERLLPGSVPGPVLEAAGQGVVPRMRRTVEARTPGTALRLEGLSVEERLMGAGSMRELLRRVTHMLLPARAGNSFGELVRIYVERVYRVVRGRVRFRDRDR